MATTAQLQALVGTEIGCSPWVTVDQGMIDRFADVTGDHQFIHIDPARAAATPFGGTIAHGFLILSLLPMMIDQAMLPAPDGVRMGVNYGSDRLRFVSPVRAGGRVRAHFTLAALVARPDRLEQTLDVTVELDGSERPAMVASWISQLFL